MTKKLFSIIVLLMLVLFAGNMATTAVAYHDPYHVAVRDFKDLCNHSFGAYRYSYDAGTGVISAHTDDYLLMNSVKQLSVTETEEDGTEVVRHYHQLSSPIVFAHDQMWAIEYTFQGGQSFVLGADAETTENLFVWHQANGSVSIGYVQHHALTEEEKTALEQGDETVVAYTWHYWTFDAALFQLDVDQTYTYRIENHPTENGGNELHVLILDQTQMVLDAKLDQYYTRKSNETEATLQKKGSTGLAGKDLVIRYLGTKDYPLSGTVDLTLQEDVNATSFDAIVKTYREATCTETGGWESVCSKCGYAEFAEDAPALGHTYGEFVVDQAASCEEAGVKSATCSECGDKIVEDIPALGHQYGDAVSNHDATCAKNGTKTSICNHCGDELTEEDSNTKLPHTWLDATCKTAKTCSACGATEGEPLPHSWKEATCLDAKYCTVCGVKDGKALGHDWKAATCLEPATCRRCQLQEGGLGNHSWIPPTCTDPETCSVCETSRGVAKGHRWKAATCTAPEKCRNCDLQQGEPLGHDWKDPTCTDPQSCSRCKETVGDPLGHSWIAASCTEKRTCERCQVKDGQPLGHSWKDATCTEPQTCGACGETEGEPLGHDWVDATCTAPKTCQACQLTEGDPLGHKWEKATCTEPKFCPVCQGTEGDPAGHKWLDATCTEAPVCKVCSVSEGEPLGHNWRAANCIAPETCTRCALTQGEALGHKWQNATCTEPQTCTVCQMEFGSPMGHLDVNDDKRCDRCNKSLMWESDQLMSWIIPVAIGLIVVIIGYIVYAEMRAKKRRYYKR